MSQGRVVVDGREPLLAVLAHISKQVVAGSGHFRRETSDRFHLLRPAEPFFELADFRDVLDNDVDRVRRRGHADQLHDETAAVFLPPRGLDGFCRAGVETAFDQPLQIVRGLEDRGRKIHLPQLFASAVTEQPDERAIDLRECAIAIAAELADRTVLEQPAIVRPALVTLGQDLRQSVRLCTQGVAVASSDLQLLAKRAELLLVHCRLFVQLRIAFGHHASSLARSAACADEMRSSAFN